MIKKALARICYPEGKERKILFGYLRGMKLIVSRNTQIAPFFGHWEPAMQKIMFNLLKAGDTFFDLGANYGLHGMLAHKRIGAQGKIVNFEPLPDNIREIHANYALNRISNYECIEAAVTNREGRTEFSLGFHPGQGALDNLGTGPYKINVPTISLDKYIRDSGTIPDFIKMDIENAEGEALEGYADSIHLSFPKMIIELHSPEADKKVGYYLKHYNYEAYRFNTFNKLQFEKIKDLSSSWPDPQGLWGSVLCLSPNDDPEKLLNI